MLFLYSDVVIFHLDGEVFCFVDLSCSESDYGFDGHILTVSKYGSSSWLTIVVDVWFLVDGCPKAVSGQFFDDMKSSARHMFPDGGSHISGCISRYGLCDTESERFARYVDHSLVIGVFGFSDNHGKRCIGEKLFSLYSEIYRYNIALLKWLVGWHTMNYGFIERHNSVGWVTISSSKRGL